MKVSNLIEVLKTLPPDANVKYVWDGSPRSDAAFVYLSNGGDVIIADYDEYVCENETMPIGAPAKANRGHYHFGSKPDTENDT